MGRWLGWGVVGEGGGGGGGWGGGVFGREVGEWCLRWGMVGEVGEVVEVVGWGGWGWQVVVGVGWGGVGTCDGLARPHPHPQAHRPAHISWAPEIYRIQIKE